MLAQAFTPQKRHCKTHMPVRASAENLSGCWEGCQQCRRRRWRRQPKVLLDFNCLNKAGELDESDDELNRRRKAGSRKLHALSGSRCSSTFLWHPGLASLVGMHLTTTFPSLMIWEPMNQSSTQCVDEKTGCSKAFARKTTNILCVHLTMHMYIYIYIHTYTICITIDLCSQNKLKS